MKAADDAIRTDRERIRLGTDGSMRVPEGRNL